jgi:flavin reductase (DIM6/NTAB) family NADH-FMN oxidoreductase RutF
MSSGLVLSLTDHEVFIVTATHEGRDNGQIATWIMPATLVPHAPRLVAVLSPQNFTWSLIRDSGLFAVNMLAEDQHDLLPLFGLLSGRDIVKFDQADPPRTPGGLPRIAECCGWMECRVLDMMDAGDRIVVLADVLRHAIEADKRPLRKREAFARQPDDIRALLEAKQEHDGQRDRALMRRWN